MPSALIGAQSGGQGLVSGGIFSGGPWPWSAFQLYNDDASPGPVYVGLVTLSGNPAVTITSGGGESSGGLGDGLRVNAGAAYLIPKARLVSGIEGIRLTTTSAQSGARVYWEFL